MKIHELIDQLQKIKNKDREVSVIIGNEDENKFIFDYFELHNFEDMETSLEIFCFINYK